MFKKVKDFFTGMDTYEDEFEEFDENEEEEDDDIEEGFSPVIAATQKKGGKVVNIHTNTSAKLMITKPLIYDDAQEICTALKNRKIVVVNTTSLELRTAQRLIDFIGGACYALCADIQEVEKGVFIVSPSNVEVSNELKDELSTKGLFNWSSR